MKLTKFCYQNNDTVPQGWDIKRKWSSTAFCGCQSLNSKAISALQRTLWWLPEAKAIMVPSLRNSLYHHLLNFLPSSLEVAPLVSLFSSHSSYFLRDLPSIIILPFCISSHFLFSDLFLSPLKKFFDPISLSNSHPSCTLFHGQAYWKRGLNVISTFLLHSSLTSAFKMHWKCSCWKC